MNKRILPLLLLIGGILLIGAGFVNWWVTQAIANPKAAVLPEKVAGLARVRATYGADAIAEVNQMHRKEFLLSSGGAGTYGQPGSMVSLWVTGTPAPLFAIRMIDQMEDAIASGESPFTPEGVRQIDGRIVNELTGMGQRHYYFRSADLVIWLAADESISEVALADVLDYYP